MSKLSKIIISLAVIPMLLAACGPQPTEAPTAMPAPTTAPAATTAPATQASSSGIDCKGANSGDTLTVVYQWSGNEEQLFNSIIKPFVDACGVKINAQSTRDDAVLDTMVKSTPPDVLFWPNFNPVKLYSDKLLPLDTVGANTGNYASYWVTMGTANGKLLTLPAKADL